MWEEEQDKASESYQKYFDSRLLLLRFAIQWNLAPREQYSNTNDRLHLESIVLLQTIKTIISKMWTLENKHQTLGWRLCHMAVFAHVLQGDFKSEFGRLPFVHKVITFGRTWWDLWRFKILRINRPLTVQSIFRITGNRCRNNRFLSSFKSTNYQPFKILQSVCLCERARRFGLKEYDWIRYLLVC